MVLLTDDSAKLWLKPVPLVQTYNKLTSKKKMKPIHVLFWLTLWRCTDAVENGFSCGRPPSIPFW
uniref:Uncharacterized protein n=1 Tax=Anguilla anguilla TaxID=7936 RepID=A0A0E9UEF3_ANGAN